MRPEPRDAAYLWDMLDAAKAIRGFVAGRSYAEYLHDRMLRGAVERHVEIIGEPTCPVRMDAGALSRKPYARIEKRVKEGRWGPFGAMWVESDSNVPFAEALVR